ncbi:YdiY family protein [Zhongshania guokunii]|uniref:YdiY family protein n=1 Tax=Zhongshania guokunii TaxID=641783 RepID=A0ABV3U608_9GAMM
MTYSKTTLAAALAAAFSASSAYAQSNPPSWKGDVEFGYFQLEGNSKESSAIAKTNGKRVSGQWTYDIAAEAQNSEAAGVRSAEKYALNNRLAYDFSEFNYSFGYASATKDRFSGYVYQATVAAGYGRRLLKTPKMTWDAEIGPGFRISEFETDSPAGDGQVSEAILRLSTDFSAAVSETATFEQKLTVESGEENTVTKSITSLKTKIVGGLGLKLSYTMTYNETVPTDTVHMDRETAVTLVYNF